MLSDASLLRSNLTQAKTGRLNEETTKNNVFRIRMSQKGTILFAPKELNAMTVKED